MVSKNDNPAPPSRPKERPSGIEPRKRGRPPKPEDQKNRTAVKVTLYLKNDDERQKLMALGGSAWLRERLAES